MEDQKRYDWEPSVRKLGETEMLPETAWQEEWQISPDCESFAAVSALEDGTFTVRLNGALWETRTDKMYNCQFAPDGRLTALSQSDGEWAIVVDDAESEEHADYLWGTRFNKAGTIAVPMQTGMEYGMLVDGAPWEQLYTAATDFVLSETGKTAAVVQTAGLGQADLEGFSKGIYTIAVDGQAWEECYLNAWSPCFDREGHRVASTVRVTPYEYTISINGQRWCETYPCAWEPIFEPKSGDVIAPIRKEGKWGLARNGSLFWKPMFAQCWAPQAAATDGEYIWAVAAPSYGAFTVACNATPWNCRFPSVTDLVLSSDGKHAAALGSQNNSRFQIAVDGKVWDDAFDMAWPVVFSPAGDRAAAKVRRDGKFALYVDGNAVIENLDGVWNPTFSPDGTVLLFCSLKDGVFSRHTVRL